MIILFRNVQLTLDANNASGDLKYYNTHISMAPVDLDRTSEFTVDHVLQKPLVIDMLQYEDRMIHGDLAKAMYADPGNNPRVSMTIEYALNRLTLSHFGFDTSDRSVENYRSICKTYWKSPNEYDTDVLQSVTYMRENKLLYYQHPTIELGDCVHDQLRSCRVHKLTGSQTNLLEVGLAVAHKHLIVAGFSLS